MAHTIARLPRGSDSQVMIKKQTAYGTAVVVDTALEAFSIGLIPRQEIIKPKGWVPGRRGERTTGRVAWNRGGEGPVSIEVPQAGSLGLWQAAFGGTNTCAKQGETVAYLATFQPGAMTVANGCALTVQTGVPDYDGDVEPFTFRDTFVKSWQATCEEGGMLEATFDLDAAHYTHATDLAAPTYGTPTYFSWVDSPHVTSGGSTLAGVRGVNISVETGANFDRLLYDNTGLRAIPVESALRKCTLELECEFSDITKTWDDLASLTTRALVVSFTGATAIAATYYPYWKFTIPAAQLVGEPPAATGPEEIIQSVKFEALDNGTDPLYKLEIMTTDVAIP
jgi:hypothetical protein